MFCLLKTPCMWLKFKSFLVQQRLYLNVISIKIMSEIIILCVKKGNFQKNYCCLKKCNKGFAFPKFRTSRKRWLRPRQRSLYPSNTTDSGRPDHRRCHRKNLKPKIYKFKKLTGWQVGRAFNTQDDRWWFEIIRV